MNKQMNMYISDEQIESEHINKYDNVSMYGIM